MLFTRDLKVHLIFHANENSPTEAVRELRWLTDDVLTTPGVGKSNQRVKDEALL